jgi:hypothetical protein
VLILVWVIEELEDRRCPACAVAATEFADGSAGAPAAAGMPLSGLLATGALAGLPSFAFAPPPSRVRVTGRARDAATPVLMERDRRDPRRHGTATAPKAPTAGPAAGMARVDEPRAAALPAEAGVAAKAATTIDQYPADVAA